jgi:hypothetical protein
MADGIIFRTTDGARWGAAGGTGTGGNLSQLQGDENMWELLTRLQALENDPPEAVSVEGFTVIGSQFQVNLSDGSTAGPYDLPIAAFRSVGTWQTDLTLLELDVFSVPSRGLYLTLIEHTTPSSPEEFDPAAVDEDTGSPTLGDPLYQLMFGEDVYIYDVGFFMPGTPGQGIDTDGEMFAHTFVRPVTLPAGAPGSYVRTKELCATDLEMSITKNGTEIGTALIEAGETEGTFDIVDDVELAIGDDFAVIKPTSADATAKGLKMSFIFTRTDI